MNLHLAESVDQVLAVALEQNGGADAASRSEAV